MREEDRIVFATYMTGLGEIFDVKLSRTRIDLYFEALADIPIESIKIACNVLARTLVFFPKPAEIRESIKPREDAALVAEQAFQSMQRAKDPYYTVIFEDGIIGRCIEALGGWDVVCSWLEEDRKWNLKNFTDIYKRYYEQGEALPAVRYTGLYEHDNGRKDLLAFIPEPIVIPALPAVRKLKPIAPALPPIGTPISLSQLLSRSRELGTSRGDS